MSECYKEEQTMMTREKALEFGMSFPNVYEERPFRDPNWQLVRVKGSKKAFLWIYEREGYTNLNVKVDPEWRDFWRNTYDAVIAGYRRVMIWSRTVRQNGYTKRSNGFPKAMLRHMGRLQRWQAILGCQERWGMRFIRIRILSIFHVSGW